MGFRKFFVVKKLAIILCECGFVDPKNYSSLKLFIEACQQRMIKGLEKAETFETTF